VAVASKLNSAALLASVRTAFVHGMDLALVVSAGIAVVGVVLTVIFLPASNAGELTVPPDSGPDGEASGTRPAAATQAA
jgi:MFS transporter, DHA2 family, multidrug resistance protein